MKLTKEQFITGINILEQMFEEENKITKDLDISGESIFIRWVDNYLSFFLDMCELPTNEYYGTEIEYFIFDLNFGKRWKPGMVMDGDKDIKLSTPEELWNYVIKED